MSNIRETLPFRTKLAFGIGSVGDIAFMGLSNTFVAIYYNQAIGLSNTLIGIAIMLALLGDAISDPVVGMVSDRWRSRLGRRHPFLFVAPIPLAICVYFMFTPPESLTNLEAGGEPNNLLLFAWLAGWTIASRVFVTLYAIPHYALGGELTKDPHDRSKLFSVNALIAYIFAAVFAFISWGVFLGGESTLANGTTVPKHLDPDAYGPLVFTVCGLVIVAILLSAWGTMNRISTLTAPPPDQGKVSFKQFYSDIRGVLANRNYLFLMIGFFLLMISVGLGETFGVFMSTYFWELETKEISLFGLAALPSLMVGAALAPALMKKFDRKPILLISLVGIVIFVQLPADLRLLGLMPVNHSPELLPLLLLNTAMLAFFLSAATVTILSMLGDVTDENEVVTGMRQEGLIFSARAFFAKASSSVGHLVAGIVLDFFVRIPKDAVPGEVDPDVIFKLGVAAGPVMCTSALFSILFYAKYHLSRAKHEAILNTLEQRNSKTHELTPPLEPIDAEPA